MFARPRELTDRWHRAITARLRVYQFREELKGFFFFFVTYLSATRTELSSCAVVMVPSLSHRRNTERKKRICVCRLLVLAASSEKKVRTLPAGERMEPRELLTSSSAPPFKKNNNHKNGPDGVFFTGMSARRRGAVSASLRSAARMLHLRRLEPTCSLPSPRAYPHPRPRPRTHTHTHTRAPARICASAEGASRNASAGHTPSLERTAR